MPDEDSPRRLIVQRGPGHYWSVTLRSSVSTRSTDERAFRRAVAVVVILDVVLAFLATFLLAPGVLAGRIPPLSAVSLLLMLSSIGYLHVRWWRRRRAQLEAGQPADVSSQSASVSVIGTRAALSWALAWLTLLVIVYLVALVSAFRAGQVNAFSLLGSIVIAGIWICSARAWWRALRSR
jgi:hypothetical protein